MKRVMLVALVVGLVGAGCGTEETTEDRTTRPASSAVPTTIEPAGLDGLVVYALAESADGTGPWLVPVAREGVTVDGPAAAIEMLMLGLTFTETGNGLFTSVPPGLTVSSVTTDAGGIVTVDLPGAFEEGGGTTAMFGRLAQLVATVLQHPDVNGMRLAIDGGLVGVFSSEGIVLDDPLTEQSIAAMIPPVAVVDPVWGAEVMVPFSVTGTAPTVGSVGWSLVDWEGRILVEGLAEVFDGAFSFEVAPGVEIDPEAAPYQHTLNVWHDEDGARSSVMECVLTLRSRGTGSTR